MLQLRTPAHAVEASEALPHWTEPGVFEVADGVFRFPLPLPQDGLRAVNVYVVLDQGGVTLIDSGWDVPQARVLLHEGLSDLGFGLDDIVQFLVTHVHRDHYEYSLAVRREFGCAVRLGRGERATLERVQQPGSKPFQPQLTTLRALGAGSLADAIEASLASGPATRFHTEMPDSWLVEGTVDVGDRQLDVVETPGHTAGHVVFHDISAGLLFAGDHVLPTITPSIGFEAVVSPNPLGSFMGSLAAVRARADAALLPAHGQVTSSVHARVDELVEHHGRRLEQTERAIARGCTTGAQIATQLTWTRREHPLSALDEFNQMLAVSETGAHADLLVAQGRVSVEIADGVRHYTIAGSARSGEA
jgi:glyoxylase-like metal-dependent hydrolase (beta-lactamase superfamily II)